MVDALYQMVFPSVAWLNLKPDDMDVIATRVAIPTATATHCHHARERGFHREISLLGALFVSIHADDNNKAMRVGRARGVG